MRFVLRCSLMALCGLAATATVASALAQYNTTIQAGVDAYDNRLSRDNRLEPTNQPPTPADQAFDPRSQVATAEPLVVQRPVPRVIGTVPITAGPTVPVVTIEGPSLQAVPGDRWVTTIYVANNSGVPVDAQIGCTFTNGSHAVQEARVLVPTAAGGTRLEVPVHGPRVDVFVDRVLCRVLTP